MNESFDIYVYEPCQAPLEGVDLAPELRERLTQVEEDFLHLDFRTKEEAAVLLRLLVAHGGEARVIDAAYREPRITLEQAHVLAAQEFEELKKLDDEPVEWNPLRFHKEDPMRWVFCAPSPELMARGMIPGALFPAIDKVDGHAWRTPEFYADADERARLLEGPATQSFDIYVYTPCQRPVEAPDVSLELRERLGQVEEDFLDLDFPTKEEAAVLLRLLVAHGGTGRVIDAAYREPLITKEHARFLAEQELEALKKLCEPAEYNPLEFDCEDPMRWSFYATSPELMAKGKIPGALFPTIDKLDGHAWRRPEFDRDAEELERLLNG